MAKNTFAIFEQIKPLEKTRHIYTVSELTQDIKLLLENTFTNIWVEGEVSGLRRISTGTLFFSLKDNHSLLKCVMFATYTQSLKFGLKDGMVVICSGRINIYEKEGSYQLYVQEVEPKGKGSLFLALEELKQRLEKEGLFSAAHKKPIPYLPSRIGIVTSLEGAAIKDILKVLERRFKDVHIIIYPVKVQGETAKYEITQAIQEFNRFNEQVSLDKRIEVMIVGRGGGSLEDLWAFNEEMVARAIYRSRIPVISAVGHERDITVADLVADLRAATPSVAAELVIPQKEELYKRIDNLLSGLKAALLSLSEDLQQTIDELSYRLSLSMQHIMKLSNRQLEHTIKKLLILNPAVQITQHIDRIQDLSRQIYVCLSSLIKLKQAELLRVLEKLSSLSPLSILARGYSITFRLPEEKIIKDIHLIKRGDKIKTKLHKGEFISQVLEKID
ncbi:MAG: exodeoxyribonuclease VII large subunit [Candidatus Omnitrophica bacterium]|nr:exodeoxyribonuclease VII large subunit [Candidatus Omnitrophota bacterium]